MAQLQRAIARKGAEIEALIAQVNPARARLDALHEQISHDEQILANDVRADRAAQSLRPAFFDRAASTTGVVSGRHRVVSVKSHLDDSIRRLELARRRTGDDNDRRELTARRALNELTRAQTDTNAAITAAKATLARVSADLTVRLVNRKHHKEAHALRASQHAIAAVLAAA